MTPEKEEYIRQWLFRASEDIAVIESLSGSKGGNFNSSICFHAQQAVEKYLKVFLVYYDIDFPKTHDIDFLLMKSKDVLPFEFNVDLRSLTEFAVNVRYPDDFYIPDMQEVKYYRSIAIKIGKIVLKQLGESFNSI